MSTVDDVNRKGFFQELVDLSPEQALYRCIQESDWCRERIKSLNQKIGEIPRADKHSAHLIRHEIMRTQSDLKRLKQSIATYRSKVDARESKFLWSNAVREVCGDDALKEVYKWMKAEKRRRNQASRDAQPINLKTVSADPVVSEPTFDNGLMEKNNPQKKWWRKIFS